MNQQQGNQIEKGQSQEMILDTPQNLDTNNNQEDSQKIKFLEQILKAQVNDDLIQFLISQLNQAKTLCLELARENSKSQETHLKNLMLIIDNSLERTKNSKNHVENDNSNNSISQEYYFNQGTSISQQDNFLTNINYVSDMNKQIVTFNQAILHSSQEDDQFEFQRGSEQFKHSDQNSDYNQMHNYQQQQKQILQIINQEEDPQSPILHKINEQLRESILVKSKAIQQSIVIYKSEYEQYQMKIKQYIESNFNDFYLKTKQDCDLLLQKHQQALQNSIQQKLNEELQQYQLCQYDTIKIKQLQKKYQNYINDYFLNLNIEGNMKKKIKESIQNQFQAFAKASEIIFVKQFNEYKTELESRNNQLEQLLQNYQQEIDQKQLSIQDLSKKYQEAEDKLSLGSIDDNNICTKISQMNRLLQETFQKSSQTTQQLDYNNLDLVIQTITKIRDTITGQSEIEIENLKNALKQREQRIIQLEKEKQDYEKKMQNNNASAILIKKIEQFQQKCEDQLGQTDKINQKTNTLPEIGKQLIQINNYIQEEKLKLKSQFEEEYNKIIQIQLEGCYKLQNLSLLYIQLGLKIFYQYYQSESQDDDKISILITQLLSIHQDYQKKKNFQLKDINEIEQFYIKSEKELKILFDQTLQNYKDFIKKIADRRNS